MEDLYKTLGVERGVDQDALKKAYRELARKFHPDRNPGNKAIEEKFKTINNAYDILSDPTKKASYDAGSSQNGFAQGGSARTHAQYGAHPFTSTVHPGFGGGRPFGDVNDLFGDIFGGAARPQVYQNQHINLNYQITLEDAFSGKEVEITYSFKNKQNQKITITIPPGIENGMKIRFTGKGDDSLRGVPAGDLSITIGIIPHARFKRLDHLTLATSESITYIDAMLGCIREMKTIDGSIIEMEVPPNVTPGMMLKVAHKGMIDKTGTRGDLLVELKLSPPKLDKTQRSILTKLQNELRLKSK